ncbi:unnamed protein product [Ectocarpus sp. CCAP 1310/34]|nr:unnamed protein product [Ectocarpus sp. CCAP 1310/34]
MRSVNVVVALLFGYFVAAVSENNGNDYVVSDKIDAGVCMRGDKTSHIMEFFLVNKAYSRCDDVGGWGVRWNSFAARRSTTQIPMGEISRITFLWVFTYPLSVYPPLILPTILAFIVTTVETIGDVTTTAEVSRLNVDSEEHFQRIRGGLLGDGISSFLAALATSMPNTTFSQNNGVIALTRCASRRAGLACACWLIVFGILAKIAAFFTSIPDCVLGGMTTFLFANVAVSGIKILSSTGDSRRSRFIVACSMGLGLGVTIAPAWATNNLWPCSDCGEGLRSFRDGVILVLSTGYSMGCAAAIILNQIIPNEAMEEELPVTKAILE